MGEKEPWYTNKELFEQILTIKDDFTQISSSWKKDIISLQSEMQQTRDTIKKYNGLREQIETLKKEVTEMKAKTSGKVTTLTAIKDWGGWVVAILMLIVNIIQN
ncbi:hypothetical protein [Oceanobacillus salinisoli]|uniref:hypothetical protein n=1 Tax=Oceanobacillus salinisoli TaxID=2678611 RepID=UPI0012E108A7|nr:hypothetical protein [Oceanobacillus salinisoli]